MNTPENAPFFMKKQFGLLLGPLLFSLILIFGPPEGLSWEGNAVLACTLWMAVWWIAEAIPIAATALLPLILFPMTGAMSMKDAATGYANPMVYLFLGGFLIAVAIERWNLHRRIALSIIHRVGTNPDRIVLGFMLATGFLSMWISNTATAVMMMPIGVAVVRHFNKEKKGGAFGKVLMLAIAYSASIGGMATLVGTPTNVVFSGVVEELYGVQLSFSQWMLFAFPFSAILLLLCWRYLVKAFRLSDEINADSGGQAEIRRQLEALGPVSPEEKRVMAVFTIVALAWICQSFLLKKILPGINDTVIAIAGALVLFLIPAPSKPGKYLLNWRKAESIPWGILLLFGGGLALAVGFENTDLATWMGRQLVGLKAAPLFLLLLALVIAVNFFTELTSNVATVSMLLPVLAALALSIGVHPYGLMVGATLAASCAFMLPVATPPNAVVFGSGYLKINDMIRAGLAMNLLSIILLTLLVYFVLPLVWGLDLSVFPNEFLKK